VAIRRAEVCETTVSRDEDGWTWMRAKHQGSQSEGKAESRRPVAVGSRSHLVEGAAGKACVWETAINLSGPKREMPERCALKAHHLLSKCRDAVFDINDTDGVGGAILN
jgi:hypothetical protein